MNNTRPLLKRVGAYLIDLCIVVIISSLISSIPALNKGSEQYQETYKEYQEKYDEYEDVLETLEEIYEEKEIEDEEYNELASSVYKDIIIEKIEDRKLTKKEYQELVKTINNEFDTVAKEYVYILNKNNKVYTIITLIFTLLYFGVLQYLLKGQTIGKRLLKIKVVSATDKKLNVLTYILRSLIVNDVLLNTVGVLFLLLASKNVYITADSILGTLISICEAIIIFTVMTREDSRGLHDLLFGTKVISTDEIEKEKPIKILEVEAPKEEPQEKKKTTKKKETGNVTKKTNKKIVDAEYKEKNTKKSTK